MVVVYMEAPGMSANTYQLLIKHHGNYNKCNVTHTCVFTVQTGSGECSPSKQKFCPFKCVDCSIKVDLLFCSWIVEFGLRH